MFLVLGLLLFSNSLNNKFLLDDYVFLNNAISSNIKYILTSLNPNLDQALGVLDTHSSHRYYRPMASMIWNFCYAVFKHNPWQYHFFNLFLFIFAATLLYLLLVKITKNLNLAFFTAVFFIIHPLNGIVVNYISDCVYSLEVIFILGTILL